MANQIGKVFTGARCRLLIEGVQVAYATGVNYGESIQMEPVEVLDQLDVAEYVPVAYRVSFSASWVRIALDPIKKRGGIKLFPKLSEILTAPELTAAIEDSVTGSTLATVHRVKASDYTANVGTKSIVLTDAQFTAIRITDENDD